MRMTALKLKIFTSLCAGFSVFSQTIVADFSSAVVWKWIFILLSVIFAAAVTYLSLEATPAPAASPPASPAPLPPSAFGPLWIALLIGALTYLLYQLIFFAQVWSSLQVTASVPFASRPLLFGSMFQSIAIASPLIATLFSTLLGATVLTRAQRPLMAALGASGVLLALAVLAQGTYIILGHTDHLASLQGVGLTVALQGLLMVWAIISLGFFAGLGLMFGLTKLQRWLG